MKLLKITFLFSVYISTVGNIKVPQNTVQGNTFLNNCTYISAWLAFFLLLLVVLMGEGILQEVAIIYPDWSLPAFFIPWFLLIISSVQKLREKKANMRFRIWILKATIPIFVFIAPFFSQFLKVSLATRDTFSGLEPYCLYLAIIVLFLVHFFPHRNNKRYLT